MSDEPQDLADVILAEVLQAEIVAPGAHMPTADAAAAAMRVAPEQICTTGFPLSVVRFR